MSTRLKFNLWLNKWARMIGTAIKGMMVALIQLIAGFIIGVTVMTIAMVLVFGS